MDSDSDGSGSPPPRTATAGDAAAPGAADATTAPPAASRKRRRAEPTELRAEKLKEFEDSERRKGVVRTRARGRESACGEVLHAASGGGGRHSSSSARTHTLPSWCLLTLADTHTQVYLSRIPPFMKPVKVRHLLERHAEVGRIYLAPEGALT